MERPDLRICSHVLHMNILSAVSKTMALTTVDTEEMRAAKLNQAGNLVREMQDLTMTVESFMSEMKEVWKVKVEDPKNIAQPQDVDELHNFPVPHFPYQRHLSYDDIWLV
jgi:hypothetical protein